MCRPSSCAASGRKDPTSTRWPRRWLRPSSRDLRRLRMAGLIAEGLQVLEHAGLVRLGIRGDESNALEFRLTRAGEAALADGAIDRSPARPERLRGLVPTCATQAAPTPHRSHRRVAHPDPPPHRSRGPVATGAVRRRRRAGRPLHGRGRRPGPRLLEEPDRRRDDRTCSWPWPGRAGLEERRDAMFAGEHINVTEDRAVLHTALRAPADTGLVVDGQDVTGDVHAVLDRMATFSERVRSGEWTGLHGRAAHRDRQRRHRRLRPRSPHGRRRPRRLRRRRPRPSTTSPTSTAPTWPRRSTVSTPPAPSSSSARRPSRPSRR